MPVRFVLLSPPPLHFLDRNHPWISPPPPLYESLPRNPTSGSLRLQATFFPPEPSSGASTIPSRFLTSSSLIFSPYPSFRPSSTSLDQLRTNGLFRQRNLCPCPGSMCSPIFPQKFPTPLTPKKKFEHDTRPPPQMPPGIKCLFLIEYSPRTVTKTQLAGSGGASAPSSPLEPSSFRAPKRASSRLVIVY